jgi:hypothetical protein
MGKGCRSDASLRQVFLALNRSPVLYQGDDVYLVVGYYTMVDAEIVEGTAKALEASARLDLPVTATLAAVGIMPLGGIADPGVKSGNSYQQGIERSFRFVRFSIESLASSGFQVATLTEHSSRKSTVGRCIPISGGKRSGRTTL